MPYPRRTERSRSLLSGFSQQYRVSRLVQRIHVHTVLAGKENGPSMTAVSPIPSPHKVDRRIPVNHPSSRFGKRKGNFLRSCRADSLQARESGYFQDWSNRHGDATCVRNDSGTGGSRDHKRHATQQRLPAGAPTTERRTEGDVRHHENRTACDCQRWQLAFVAPTLVASRIRVRASPRNG